MAKQKAHWCLTILEEDVLHSFTDEGRQKFLEFAGNRLGFEIAHKNGISYHFTIGPMEGQDENTQENHYHCLFSSPKGKAATKGRCIELLDSIGFVLGPTYVQPLDSTLTNYLNYMFKSVKTKLPSTDQILADAGQQMRESGENLTKRKFLDLLLNTHGATWVTKNKSVIDTFTSTTLLFDPSRLVEREVDPEEIKERVTTIIDAFNSTIYDNLLQFGYECKHAVFNQEIQDIDLLTLSNFITFISIIPYLFNRCEQIDNIPALYLYGEPGAGKSFVYSFGRSYKHLASDAAGVGRYKLEGNESGILLDDVHKDFIDDEANFQTLRTLTLGNTGRVKVHGDTQQINAFIVITSNDEPVYLKQNYSENQALAWKRRFISIKFVKENFKDFLLMNGTEMDYRFGKVQAAKILSSLYTNILAIEPKMAKLIAIYYNKLTNYISCEEMNNATQIAYRMLKKRMYDMSGASAKVKEFLLKRPYVDESDDEERLSKCPRFDYNAYAR